MAKTPERPDYVKNFDRPKGTEIKYINGGWYLYEVSSVYVKELKRARKVSGKELGLITPDGLSPSKSEAIKKPPLPSDVVEVGATYYFYERTLEMRDRLQKYFPDTWQEIYVLALVKAMYENRFRRINVHYENSILSYMFPGLKLQKSCLTPFLQELGRQRNTISQFMLEDVRKDDRFILFDGHRILSASKTMDFAERGYDSKHRYMPQNNVVYMFTMGENTGIPAYYEQFPGSAPDINAFHSMLKEIDCYGKDCTIVGDKGFGCEDDFELLQEKELKYVISLKRGNIYVKDGIPASYRDYEYAFTYHGRTIQSKVFDLSEKKGFKVFLFLDNELLNDEMNDLTKRAEKDNQSKDKRIAAEEKIRANGKGGLTDEQLKDLQPIPVTEIIKNNKEMGTISIRTNRLDLNCEQVYCIYKQREKIEQFFKTYGNTLGDDASYLRDIYSQEAWYFLNHLSAIMCVNSLEEIDTLGKSKDVSFEDLRTTLEKIKAVRMKGNIWSIMPRKNSVEKLCESLELEIEDLSVLGL